MKIVLASTSAVKISACNKAFAGMTGINIVTVKVPSGIAAQPMSDETLRGAFNRIENARIAIPNADLYVSIENGIFEENGDYVDRAVVVIAKKNGMPKITYSDGVIFPRKCVEEARNRGFDTWTVGKVMQEQGVVSQHDDPHKDLSGKSRIEYINDAMRSAVSALRFGS